jgi:L-lactate dehydrogenase (cytochrome)
MARAVSIGDLRARANRRTPKAVFDHVDGAADDEVSLKRSRAVCQELEFQPSVLRDVLHADASTSILGRDAAFPFGFAPTGYTRMMHHEGEAAVARVAQRMGIPYALSTMGTTTPEDVATAAPDADRCFSSSSGGTGMSHTLWHSGPRTLGSAHSFSPSSFRSAGSPSIRRCCR